MDNTNITSIAMAIYLSFSIIFFTSCLFYDWPVLHYLVLFLVFMFGIQLAINMWAMPKVCPSSGNNADIGKSFGFTFVPWLLVLVAICSILYIMPGWVRVFSNTIGLAVAKSVYYELFTADMKDEPSPRAPTGPTVPIATAKPRPDLDKQGTNKIGGAPDEPATISPHLVNMIYHDPSNLINEIEYLPDFAEWKKRIFDTYLKSLPYFKNPVFFNEKDLYILKQSGGDGAGPPGPGEPEPKSTSDAGAKDGRTLNPKNNIYRLYKCIATKEKIGYFTWLFLSGAIFTLTSLSQLYESDC